MSNALAFIVDHLPPVTEEDIRHFSNAVEIRDARAFAAELQAFMHERLAGRSPIEAAEADSIHEVVKAVLNTLGLHSRSSAYL